MEKKLIIMRHVEAENSSFDISDWERNLTNEGKKMAKRVGNLIKNYLIPEKIISSDAVRTRQTAEIVLSEFGIEPSNIFLEPTFYLASYLTMQNNLNKMPEEINSVMIVAHNPGVSDLVENITSQYVMMLPATVVIIRLPISSWKFLTQEIGILEKIITA